MVSPELSVLIVNYNTWWECVGAIRSLRQNPPTRPDGSVMPFEVIVVDNKSPDQPPAAIVSVRTALAEISRDFDDPESGQLIMHDENSGYSKGVNLCYHRSRGRWILVSNPDLSFPPGCISTLQRHLEAHPTVGCVVPKGYWDDDFMGQLPPNTLPTLTDLFGMTFGEYSRWLRRRYGRWLARGWVKVWQADAPLDLRMMSGCLFLVERDYFESIGLMDERYPLYYEDADLSIRIGKSGRTLTQVADSKLVHFVNRSGQTDVETMMTRHDKSRAIYFRKWYGRLGSWLLSACQAIERAPWLRWLRKTAPDGSYTDLGESDQPPVIELPKHWDEFLLLMSLDSRFYLSGGVFGSGDRWTPSPVMFNNFSATVYWYRAYDLTDGGFREIGTWSYSCKRHLGHSVIPGSADTAEVAAGS